MMLMSYLGTVKSWIYRPIFQVFGSGVAAMRFPMLLAGVASIWLFYLLLRRAAGERAAIFGCGLLAADSLYLLTTCFDWGPVALQHLLVLAGMLLLLGFYQERSHRRLGWGCFLLGLAMWDKALATWMIVGIGLALLVVFPKQILGVLTLRRVAIAVLGFRTGRAASDSVQRPQSAGHFPREHLLGHQRPGRQRAAPGCHRPRERTIRLAHPGRLADPGSARSARRVRLGICQDFGTRRAAPALAAALRVHPGTAARAFRTRPRLARRFCSPSWPWRLPGRRWRSPPTPAAACTTPSCSGRCRR